MNPTAILSYLAAFGLPLVAQQLAAAIKIKLAVNPNLTDDQLVSNEDGSLKHAIRGKIGWLVDFIWPDVEPTLDGVIRQAAAEARAQLEAGEAAPVVADPTLAS